MRLVKGLIAAAIAASLLLLPAGALAKGRDRDHDRMPDKWEKKHHLNPRANAARRDPDRDHLSNLSEFRHHTDPQKADTDGDDVDDAVEVHDGSNPDDPDEISGTVASFENGVLTIQLAGDGAGTVSGTVNDATRIECDGDENENEENDDDDAPAANASDDGGRDDNSGPGGDDNDEANCSTANLTPGAKVGEAKFVTAGDGSVTFTKLEL
jgi:hypothetical protein